MKEEYPGPPVYVDLHKSIASLYSQGNEWVFGTPVYCNEFVPDGIT